MDRAPCGAGSERVGTGRNGLTGAYLTPNPISPGPGSPRPTYDRPTTDPRPARDRPATGFCDRGLPPEGGVRCPPGGHLGCPRTDTDPGEMAPRVAADPDNAPATGKLWNALCCRHLVARLLHRRTGGPGGGAPGPGRPCAVLFAGLRCPPRDRAVASGPLPGITDQVPVRRGLAPVPAPVGPSSAPSSRPLESHARRATLTLLWTPLTGPWQPGRSVRRRGRGREAPNSRTGEPEPC